MTAMSGLLGRAGKDARRDVVEGETNLRHRELLPLSETVLGTQLESPVRVGAH